MAAAFPSFQLQTDEPERNMTATEIFNDFVEKTKKEVPTKSSDKSLNEWLEVLQTRPCSLHPKKISEKCRKCKLIKDSIDDFRLKEEEFKKKSNLPMSFANPDVGNMLYSQYQQAQPKSGKDLGPNQFQPSNNIPKLDSNNLNINYNTVNVPMQITGDSTTFNINPLLRENILMSAYFKELFHYKYMEEIVQEIVQKATHAEPWAHAMSGVPSTLFCCLYRLMLMKLSEDQIRYLMEYEDSPYVKCTGFLYMRYCCDPVNLWNKLAKYLYIDEVFKPSLDLEAQSTIGVYVENLFTELNYYGTRLPRIPLMIEREIKKKIMIHHEKKHRREENLKIIHKFKSNKEVRVYCNNQKIRKGVIESVEGKLIKVHYYKENNESMKCEDGFKQLEKLEELFLVGEGAVNEDADEEFVPLQDQELVRPDANDADHEEDNDYFRNIYRNEKPNSDKEEKNKNKTYSSSVSKDHKKDKKKKSNRKLKSYSRERENTRHKRSRSRNNKKDRSRSRDKSRSIDKHKKRRKYSNSSSYSQEKRHRRRSPIKQDKKKNHKDTRNRDKTKRDKKKKKHYSTSSSSQESSKSQAKEKVIEHDDNKNKDRYLEEIKRKEREGALAFTKADYARRPTSYKASLSNPIVNYHNKKNPWSPSPEKKVIHVVTNTNIDQQANKRTELNNKIDHTKDLIEKYGDVKIFDNKGIKKIYSEKLDEGPDFMRLGGNS